MSQSDRISIRPECFGTYTPWQRADRACGSCKSAADCIPPKELTMAGSARPARSKYHREIKPGVFIDVYSVLVAFGVTNPADAHAIKKLLMPGMRGHKDGVQDRREAIASIQRAIEIEEGKEFVK